MKRRVCIVTAGSVASTPRAVRAADALHAAGYAVRVVDADYAPWSRPLADQLAASRPWPLTTVRWLRDRHPAQFWATRVRHRACRATARPWLGLAALAAAQSRVGPELVRAVAAEPTDLVYAGTAGGLAVGVLAAGRLGVPYALDLEDFHSEEQPPGAEVADRRMEWIERRVLGGAAFVTAGSGPIADAVAAKYGVRPFPVHNLEQLPAPPAFDRTEPGRLRLLWFGQTVGSGRGLEQVVAAAERAGRAVRIGLFGHSTRFVDELLALGREAGPTLAVDWLGVCRSDELVTACRKWDVGLAVEPGFSVNNGLALSNKLCTYLAAGLALAATRTRGQLTVAPAVGDDALWYDPDRPDLLADGLRRWADDPAALLRAKQASWAAARSRWHWDHPLEKGALLAAVEKTIGTP